MTSICARLTPRLLRRTEPVCIDPDGNHYGASIRRRYATLLPSPLIVHPYADQQMDRPMLAGSYKAPDPDAAALLSDCVVVLQYAEIVEAATKIAGTGNLALVLPGTDDAASVADI